MSQMRQSCARKSTVREGITPRARCSCVRAFSLAMAARRAKMRADVGKLVESVPGGVLGAAGAAVVAGAVGVGLARAVSPTFNASYVSFEARVRARIVYAYMAFDRAMGGPFTGAGGVSGPPNPMSVSCGDPISTKWLWTVLNNASWLPGKIPKIAKVTLSGDGLAGGFVGVMVKLHIEYEGEAAGAEYPRLPHTLVLKTNQASVAGYRHTFLLCTAREGLFYKEFGMDGGKFYKEGADVPLPGVYYAMGNRTTGEFLVLMEDLGVSGTPGKHILGNQCWGPAPAVPADIPQDAVSGLQRVVTQFAHVHAKFWRSKRLLECTWLKNVRWNQGYDRPYWELGMQDIINRWNLLKAASAEGRTSVKYPASVVKAVDTLVEGTSWKNRMARVHPDNEDNAWSLVQGDCHAGNMLWARKSLKHSATRFGTEDDSLDFWMVDLAEIGVGDPSTEMAQFFISDATIDVRRKNERQLMELYHAQLVEKGVDAEKYPFEVCWRNYQYGGIERWLQMMIFMGSFNLFTPAALPDEPCQWFVNQVVAFVEDHFDSVEEHLRTSGFLSGYCMVM